MISIDTLVQIIGLGVTGVGVIWWMGKTFGEIKNRLDRIESTLTTLESKTEEMERNSREGRNSIWVSLTQIRERLAALEAKIGDKPLV